MKQLSGLDAAFLSLETDHTPMNVVGTIILDPSTARGRFSYERVLKLLEERLHRLPPMRRRLVEVPFGLGHGVWIEDPKFALERHVRRVVARPPGTERILTEIVGRFAAQPLNRARPLWQILVVENLSEGRVALVIKMHHAAADGVASAQMMLQLLDPTPDPAPMDPSATPMATSAKWEPESAPGAVGMLGKALFGMALKPARMAGVARDTLESLADLTSHALAPTGTELPAALPLTAPRTRFNGSISPARSVAYSRARFQDLHFVKSVFGTSINDVVLAACTHSLRNYLQTRNDLPHEPLVATIPVCTRSGEEWTEQGNHLSALFVHLPVHLADPLDQLLAVQSSCRQAKRFHATWGANKLRDWARFTTPALFSNAIRLYSKLRLADKHPPVYNLVISNVPGPSEPLYAAGARVVAAYPLGPIFDGAGLNITVMSYVDSVDFGVIACRESVPEVEAIAHGFSSGIGDLVKLALNDAPKLQPAG